ncbi:hypothetical protein [Paenibacillus gyeongsangnamensis]|uniref:hypothetical protein n=1 Tax=Paenibacillus gyeongsangnamensis TaxID=3388067 RepID=UPI0022B88545|nr:hypothetical protein [Paenibacillus filicis]
MIRHRYNDARGAGALKSLSSKQKKWLLSFHLLFDGILLGESVVIVIVSIAALSATSREVLQACYLIMNLIARTGIRASMIGTVLTGILLSVLTRWGLFRYYWIMVKEGLTLLSIGIGVIGFYVWSFRGLTMISAEGLEALHNPVFQVNTAALWTGIALQIMSLAGMTVISVFKPWGSRGH